jgi:uridylate kinase
MSMRIVLRIGGSVVASPVNTELISKYADLLKNLKEQGHEVAVVVGGGTLAREFIAIAKKLGLDEQAQDELAISVSRIFAQLFLKKIGKMSCEVVPLTVDAAADCLGEGKIMVMGGLKPGMTTDTVAALIAQSINADLLIKATDVDGVFNKDPKQHRDAKKFAALRYDELPKIFEKKRHEAGIHQVIDPEAIGILKKVNVKTVVLNGFNPENVLAAVQGKKIGTVIS